MIDTERLAFKPWCAGADKRAIVRPRARALQFEYVQLNLPTAVNAIVVDVDRPVDPFFWEDAGAPVPNFVVRHPDKHTAHVIYLLTVPVRIAQGGEKPRPQRWLESLERGLHTALGGDIACRRPMLVKNPGHPAWRTHSFRVDPYDLAELDYSVKKLDLPDFAPSDPRMIRDKQREELIAQAEAEGRNCALFEAARLHAYEVVDAYRSVGDHEGWRAHVLSFVEREHSNQFAHRPLPYHEIRSISKSVAKWTWARYYGSRQKNRGVLAAHLDPAMSKHDRQVAGAHYAAKQRREKTLASIAKAVQRLQTQLQRTPTQTELAAAARISLSSVKRHWPTVIAALSREDTRTSPKVSVGAYQGQPGPRGGLGSRQEVQNKNAGDGASLDQQLVEIEAFDVVASAARLVDHVGEDHEHDGGGDVHRRPPPAAGRDRGLRRGGQRRPPGIGKRPSGAQRLLRVSRQGTETPTRPDRSRSAWRGECFAALDVA